jgi:hypothetical protein
MLHRACCTIQAETSTHLCKIHINNVHPAQRQVGTDRERERYGELLCVYANALGSRRKQKGTDLVLWIPLEIFRSNLLQTDVNVTNPPEYTHPSIHARNFGHLLSSKTNKICSLLFEIKIHYTLKPFESPTSSVSSSQSWIYIMYTAIYTPPMFFYLTIINT